MQQNDFPEKWAIRITQEVKNWIREEFNSTYYDNNKSDKLFHFPNLFNYNEYSNGFHAYNTIQGKYTEITLEQFKVHVLKQKTTEMKQTLTRKQLIELYNEFTCSDFRNAITDILSLHVLSLNDSNIHIPQSHIDNLIAKGTEDQKKAVIKLGIVLEEDKSVDTKNAKIVDMIGNRSCGEYQNKAFYLSHAFNWKIQKDEDDGICLIPTKK